MDFYHGASSCIGILLKQYYCFEEGPSFINEAWGNFPPARHTYLQKREAKPSQWAEVREARKLWSEQYFQDLERSYSKKN